MTIERYNYNDEPSGRTETLVQALDRCERLEKQLKIAVEALEKGINGACPYYPEKTARTDMFYALKSIQKNLGIALQHIKDLEK